MSKSMDTHLKGKIVSFGISEVETKDYGLSSEKRVIRGYANKAVIDRGRDLVLPEAYKSSKEQFMRNPLIFYNHDWDMPIGKIVDLQIRDDGLFVVGELAKGIGKSDQVWDMIGQKLVQSFSIGFIPKQIDYEPEKDIFVIKDLELLEVSVVTIPMNADALFEPDAKSGIKSVSIETPGGLVVGYKTLTALQENIKTAELKALETLINSEVEQPKTEEIPVEETKKEEPMPEPIEKVEEEIRCMICNATEFKHAIHGYSAFGQSEYVCTDCIFAKQDERLQPQIHSLQEKIATLTETIASLTETIAKLAIKTL